jgi:hypothetical protein
MKQERGPCGAFAGWTLRAKFLAKAITTLKPKRPRSFAVSCVGMLGGVLCLAISPGMTFAEEPKAEDAYQSVWADVSELVRRREYGSAMALLDVLADDSTLQYHGNDIEQDRTVIVGLQTLERLVCEQASKLPAGSDVVISGTALTLVKYESDPQGDVLILKSKVTSFESRKPIAGLPPSTWVKLAESRLETLEHRELTLGVFFGFDQSADLKVARKFLNEAASRGDDVTRWLGRLANAESGATPKPADRKQTNDDDAIVGHWRLAGREGGRACNTEFRADGTTVTTFPPEVLAEIRKQKRRPPLNPDRGRWAKNEDGSYQLTHQRGATVRIILAGDDRFVGRMANGARLVGLRQATP